MRPSKGLKKTKSGISDYNAYWSQRIQNGHFEFTDMHRKIIEIAERALEFYDFEGDRIRIWDLNQGLPLHDRPMDLIIASRVAHHLADPIVFLRDVRRTLSDHGWFMGVIPNICYYHHRLKFLVGKFPPISNAHVNFQTGPEFEKMVGAEGFELRLLTTPKKTLRARLWLTIFSQDLIYVFRK